MQTAEALLSLEEIYSQLKVDSIPEPVFDSLTGQTVMKIVDVQINRLRQKLEPETKNTTLIETVPGIGYRLMK